MLSGEEIEELYFNKLEEFKIFQEIDVEYCEYLKGCLDILEKVLGKLD